MASRRDVLTGSIGAALAAVAVKGAGAETGSASGSSAKAAAASSGAAYQAGQAVKPLDIINLFELEKKAEQVIPKAPFGYISSGSGDEWTLRQNTAAFYDRQILPRYLKGFDAPDTSTEILGSKIDMPVFVPPMAAHGLAHESAERGSAKGAGDAGALFCAQTLANVPLEDIAAVNSGPKWFQLYFMKDPGVNREIMQRAKEAGCSAIVFTVDLEWPGNREADKKNGFTFPSSLHFPNIPNAPVGASLQDLGGIFKRDLSFDDMDFIAKESGLPVIVKGLLTPDNAKECVARGASAIQVSNHGGRQLDMVPAAISALPDIVEAVGPDVPVFLDGGVRRGTHIFQALALGASAVGVGRPTLYSLALGGAPGVQSMLETLKEEFALAMKLAGCATVSDITRKFVT